MNCPSNICPPIDHTVICAQMDKIPFNFTAIMTFIQSIQALNNQFLSPFISTQGVWLVLSVAEDLHWPVDCFPLHRAGSHGCQFPRMLHHSFHRGSLRLAHLHNLHLWGLGEAHPPGRLLPLQQEQQPGQTHHIFVCGSEHHHTTIHFLKEGKKGIITWYISWRYAVNPWGHPDVHVLPQMFMRWAFWPNQQHTEVLGDEQCHCVRNLLGSTGGQGTDRADLV